jgi:hypothetical protein
VASTPTAAFGCRAYRVGSVRWEEIKLIFFISLRVILDFFIGCMWGHVHLSKMTYVYATSALTSRPYMLDLLSFGFNSEICLNCKKLVKKW